MAQISKGIQLGYASVADEDSRPSGDYSYIRDLTGIPALGASPSTHQVTNLDDAMHTYIKGLVDLGGTLEFPCNFSSDVIDDVDAAITMQDSGLVEWCVEFPAPLSKRAYFIGEAEMVFNESVDVDAPVTGTLSIVPNTAVEWEDIAE